MVPGIECAMAYLLQFQVITAADIWVFTRVVEDAMTFVLVRSREQSTLVSCRLDSKSLLFFHELPDLLCGKLILSVSFGLLQL